jgi:hypothetical protein
MGTWAEWGPTIVAIVTAIFIAGQVTGRIKDQEKTLVRHDEILGEHATLLGKHAVSIAESQAWRRGYEAGKGPQR